MKGKDSCQPKNKKNEARIVQIKYQASGPETKDREKWKECANAWKKIFKESNTGDVREGMKHKCYITIYLIRIKAPETKDENGIVTTDTQTMYLGIKAET